jgi:hypothetical protein
MQDFSNRAGHAVILLYTSGQLQEHSDIPYDRRNHIQALVWAAEAGMDSSYARQQYPLDLASARGIVNLHFVVNLDIPCVCSGASSSGTDSKSSSESESSSSLLHEFSQGRRGKKSKRDKAADKPGTPGKGRHDKGAKKDKRPQSGSSVSRGRKSISESLFMQRYDDVLKPLYPTYQAMQMAANGCCFQWEAGRRKACVNILLAASKDYDSPLVHSHFKKAVDAELCNGFVRF